MFKQTEGPAAVLWSLTASMLASKSFQRHEFLQALFADVNHLMERIHRKICHSAFVARIRKVDDGGHADSQQKICQWGEKSSLCFWRPIFTAL